MLSVEPWRSNSGICATSQLEELGKQKGKFCKQMAELQRRLSAVNNESDAAVWRGEAIQAEHLELQEVSTEMDAEHFQSHIVTLNVTL